MWERCAGLSVPQSGVQLPYLAINRNIAESLDIVVHLERGNNGKRHVDQVIRIKSYDHATGWYDFETLYGLT
jgi:Flp pilus assembly CpaF family ATPase